MQNIAVQRQQSIFGGGHSFQPMQQTPMGQQGRIPIVGGVFQRQPFMGQVRTATWSGQQQQQTVPTQPAPIPMLAQPQQQQQQQNVPFEARPGRRVAWGRLKKLDAQELAAQLAAISERMKAAGIPPGIVDQVRGKLDAFVASAPATAEVEITEQEAQQLDAAILSLEEAEGRPSGVSTALVVAGVGLAAILLLS